MSRKIFYLSGILPFFVILNVAFAQQFSPQAPQFGQQPSQFPQQSSQPGQQPFQQPGRQPSQAGKQPTQQIQGGFRPGPGFPGFPGSVPKGTRWVPGHFEVMDGRQVWIPGGYRPVDKSKSATLSTTPPQFSPNQQSAPPPAQGGFVNPSNNTGQGQNVNTWLPGNYRKGTFGKDPKVMGNSTGKQSTVPKGIPTSPGTEQAISDKLKAPIANVKPQGWAVVIGISQYQYASSNFPELRYAAKDARAFYNFLRSPDGGGFPPERILFLENDRATLGNIRYAFFDFLKQALEEDYVLIYFSGHGTPEENNPKNLYLMAYDTKPNQIASSAFPMWDIDTAFSRHIKSNKIIMLADACHSAGIGSDIATRGINKKNMINKELLDVARDKKGRILFTGSEAGELSQESRKWGGGHGVFTYFILNGLKGEADVNDDNIITLGELIDFVSENVRRSTKNTQHPNVAGTFDRGFPLASFRP